eukprot:TRINITY_DN47_c0_g1_i13.p1 TRINITY_DN47_c0_g1~~TRINITY_DN47_c0_g1_i13.p1  ORF type:complete len:429 (+),score=97.85 TRINITY_DN47_c0_g1_i13:78-1289(+)
MLALLVALAAAPAQAGPVRVHLARDADTHALERSLPAGTAATFYCEGSVATQYVTSSPNTIAATASTAYGNNWNCKWIITASSAYTVKLTFTLLDTEAIHDVVRVYDGPDFSSPLVASYSGKYATLPAPLTASGTAFSVSFTTDGSIVGPGFAADVLFETTGPVYCDGNNSTRTMTAPTGEFAVTSTPPYGINWACFWVVDACDTCEVTIVFTKFNLAQGYDHARVFADGTFTTQIGSDLRGSTIPAGPFKAAYAMSVSFFSDFGGGAEGFTATYTTVDVGPTSYCIGPTFNTTLTAPTYAVQSSPGPYGNGWTCRWSIKLAGAETQVSLRFESFDTEPNNDVVRVYNGDNFNTLLGTHSGTTLPPAYYSNRGSGMSIQFTTDGSVVRNGWRAIYAKYSNLSD